MYYAELDHNGVIKGWYHKDVHYQIPVNTIACDRGLHSYLLTLGQVKLLDMSTAVDVYTLNERDKFERARM